MEQKLEKKTKKEKKGLWASLFKKERIKKSKIAVLFLGNNGVAQPMELESKKGFFEIKGKVYHEDRDCIYSVAKERYPLAIIPEWSLIPYGTKKWHDKPMLEKFSECQDHHIRAIRRAELVRMGEKDKGQINTKAIVIVGILVIIAMAFVMGYK